MSKNILCVPQFCLVVVMSRLTWLTTYIVY